MIVQCPGCERRYRVSDEVVNKKRPVRFRCTRCGHIFSSPPGPIRAVGEDPVTGQPRLPEESDFRRIAELLDDIKSGEAEPDDGLKGKRDVTDTAPMEEPDGYDTLPAPGQRSPLVSGWFIFLVICLAGVVATLVFWQSPPVRTSVTAGFAKVFSSLEEWIGSRDTTLSMDAVRQNIELVDIQESVHNNWITGKILLIEGIAVNRNDVPLSAIRVRGTLMAADKRTVAETEAYCGNLLSGGELRNLTKKEIERELLMPSGRDQRGVTIPPGGPIPFMLAFINPPEEAGHFAVELVDITLPRREDRR
ncbi:MAG: zinc-ribbon domain-containing protein [Syntrophales bacterium]|nr:zinc-ribbon domain-containing protein [Syntrophales bacterium]MCK9528487.1 zinc-ribbon domain-containing protein [Syntrophales bacterium]MDX9923024.1 DUF3426 domain-containing protein [Syntrophales bacterium]